jgi:ABC-type antimicrobial peptide transport system permease subunit
MQQEAVVNRAFADRYWPGQSVLGRGARHNRSQSEWAAVIVGVVENVRQWGPESPPLPEIYFAYEVEPRPMAKLIVLAQTEPVMLVNVLREELARLDENLPLSDVRTMEQVFAKSTAHRRVLTLLIHLFMWMTLFLALTGVYGVLSYQVSQQTRAIGIRVAFGAARRTIAWLVLRQALRLGGIGVAFGVLGTLNICFVLRRLFYGIHPLNPVYLVTGGLLVLAVALIAGYLPARRATRVEPMQALRCE